MKQYSLYDSGTGLFVGRTFGTDLADPATHAQALAANTPPGHAAIEGHHDHLSRRVDLATGHVIDYQPPAPSPDHEWHAPTKRWRLSEAAQAAAATRADARARIAELEAASGPLVRKAVLGDVQALTALRMLDAEIAGVQVV